MAIQKDDIEIHLNTDWEHSFPVNATGYTEGRLQIRTRPDDGLLVAEPIVEIQGAIATATLSRSLTVETAVFTPGVYFYDLLLQNADLSRFKKIEGKAFIRDTVTHWTDTPPISPAPTPIDQISQKKIAFSWGDATPKPILTVSAGKTVFTAQIVITVPFNGVGAALRLGDAGDLGRLMSSSAIAPSIAAEWETNPGYTYSVDTQILLEITPGTGASQGSGFVILEI